MLIPRSLTRLSVFARRLIEAKHGGYISGQKIKGLRRESLMVNLMLFSAEILIPHLRRILLQPSELRETQWQKGKFASA